MWGHVGAVAPIAKAGLPVAKLLPAPLYQLHGHAMALADAQGVFGQHAPSALMGGAEFALTVEVVGTAEEAQAFQAGERPQHRARDGDDDNAVPSGG